MKKYLAISIALIFGLFSASCSKEGMVSSDIEKGEPIKVSFRPEVCGNTVTPMTKSAYSFNENAINDLNVLLFDGKSTSTNGYIESYYIQSNNLNDVELIAGRTYTVAVVANYGSKISTNDVSAITISENHLKNGHLVMTGTNTFVASSSVVPVTVKRCVARIDLSIQWGELANTDMHVSKIEIKYPNNSMKIFSATSKRAPGQKQTSYEGYDYATDGPVANDTYSFYLLENMQGSQQVLSTGKKPSLTPIQILCTCIDVTIEGSDPLNGTVKYSFYPGADNVKNFDIQRNTIYDITLSLSKNIYDSSWKVTPNWDYNSGSASNYLSSVSLDSDAGAVLYNGERFKLTVTPKSNLAQWCELSSCTVEAYYSGTETKLTTPPVITNWTKTGNAYSIVLEANFTKTQMIETGSFEDAEGIMVDYKLLDPEGKVICPIITNQTVLPPYLYGDTGSGSYGADQQLPEILYLTVGSSNTIYFFPCTTDRRNLIAVCQTYGFNFKKFQSQMSGTLHAKELVKDGNPTIYDDYINLFDVSSFNANSDVSVSGGGNYLWKATNSPLSSKTVFVDYPKMVNYYSIMPNDIMMNINSFSPQYFGESFYQKIWHKAASIQIRKSGNNLQIINPSGVPLYINAYFTGMGGTSNPTTGLTKYVMFTSRTFACTPCISCKSYTLGATTGSSSWVTIDSSIFGQSSLASATPRVDFTVQVYEDWGSKYLDRTFINYLPSNFILWYGDNLTEHSNISSTYNLSTKMPGFSLASLQSIFSSTKAKFTLRYSNNAFTLSGTNTSNYSGSFTVTPTISGIVNSVASHEDIVNGEPLVKDWPVSATLSSYTGTFSSSTNKAVTNSNSWNVTLPNNADDCMYIYGKMNGDDSTEYNWYGPATLRWTFSGSCSLSPSVWILLNNSKLSTVSDLSTLTWYWRIYNIGKINTTTDKSTSMSFSFAKELESQFFSKYYQPIYIKDYTTVPL